MQPASKTMPACCPYAERKRVTNLSLKASYWYSLVGPRDNSEATAFDFLYLLSIPFLKKSSGKEGLPGGQPVVIARRKTTVYRSLKTYRETPHVETASLVMMLVRVVSLDLMSCR